MTLNLNSEKRAGSQTGARVVKGEQNSRPLARSVYWRENAERSLTNNRRRGHSPGRRAFLSDMNASPPLIAKMENPATGHVQPIVRMTSVSGRFLDL